MKYPGFIDGQWWDKSALIEYMSPVLKFQKKYNIPNNRIIAAEFGCDQRCPGADLFLKHMMACLEDMGCHFGFYGWGPDSGWVGRDYVRNPQAFELQTMIAIDEQYQLINQINQRDIKIMGYLMYQANECIKALNNNPAQIQVEQIPSIIKKHLTIIPLLNEPHKTAMAKFLSEIADILLKRQSPKSTRNCTCIVM